MEITISVGDKIAALFDHVIIGDREKEIKKVIREHALKEYEKSIRWHHEHALRLIKGKTKLNRCIEVADRLRYEQELPEPAKRLHEMLSKEVFEELDRRIDRERVITKKAAEELMLLEGRKHHYIWCEMDESYLRSRRLLNAKIDPYFDLDRLLNDS